MVISVNLYLKRSNAADNMQFEIFDKNNNTVFKILAVNNSSKEIIKIFNIDNDVNINEEVCKIRAVKFSSLKLHNVSSGNIKFRIIIMPKDNQIFARFYGIGWHIRGSIVSGSYDIIDLDNSVIAAVSKNFSNNYTQISIFSEQKTILAVASIICLENIALERKPVLQMS